MRSAAWRLSSQPGAEKTLANELIGLIREDIRSEERLEEIATAVTEACLNAMEHGNGFDLRKSVTVTLTIGDHSIVVRITDEGQGWQAIPFRQATPEDIWSKDDPRGWGLLLIHRFADKVHVGREEGGTFLELHFFKRSPSEGGEADGTDPSHNGTAV